MEPLALPPSAEVTLFVVLLAALRVGEYLAKRLLDYRAGKNTISERLKDDLLARAKELQQRADDLARERNLLVKENAELKADIAILQNAVEAFKRQEELLIQTVNELRDRVSTLETQHNPAAPTG